MYRLSRDGPQINTYHNLCDNKGATLNLFFLKMGNIVGFFANDSIDSVSGWKSDDKCFIFNLSKKMRYKQKNNNRYSFYCKNNCGPSASGLGCNRDETLNYIFHSANAIDNYFIDSPSKLLQSNGVEKRYEVEETEIFQIKL